MAADASPATGNDAAVRRHFENQARACDGLGSPFTARVCRALAAGLDPSTTTGRRVLQWQGDAAADALALRLCGGLHALVLQGADEALAAAFPPNAVGDALLGQTLTAAIARNDDVLNLFIDCAPQTNEVARSAMLLPGLLVVARETGLPLALHEIGSSAGLNLLFDRFHYRYGENEWGEAGSPVRLAPEIRGMPPPLGGTLEIAVRHGSDISPVDVSDPQARLRLRSYVWADQTARLERLDAALKLAAAEPFELERADAADFLEQRLAERRSGRVFVLMHSIMWQYMTEETRSRIERLLSQAGHQADRAAPLAWLRMEPRRAIPSRHSA